MEFKKNDCISNNFSFNNTLYKRRFTFLPVKNNFTRTLNTRDISKIILNSNLVKIIKSYMIFLHITILFMQKIKRKAEIFNQKDKIVYLVKNLSRLAEIMQWKRGWK